MTKYIKVSSKGQIVVPKEIREEIGIEPADKLMLTKVGDKIVLERAPTLEEIREKVKPKKKPVTEKELKKAVREGLRERLRNKGLA